LASVLDHQFVTTEGDALQGVWFEDNGSIVCRWWWNPVTAELLVRRGSQSLIEAVSSSGEMLADSATLQEELKSAALEIAQRMT